MMSKRSVLPLRDRVEAMFSHDPAHFPFTDRDSFVSKLSCNLPTPIGVIARMEGLLNPLDQLSLFQTPTVSLLFLDSPLVILFFADSQHSAHPPHAEAGVQAFHRLAFSSRARIKMCRDFFRISTFSLSSASSLSFCFSRFSSSLTFRFESFGSVVFAACSRVLVSMALGMLFFRRWSLTHLHTVFVSIPNSSATDVADFPEFNMWRTVRSLISSVYFELLLGMVSHLPGFYPYDIMSYPLIENHTSPKRKISNLRLFSIMCW